MRIEQTASQNTKCTGHKLYLFCYLCYSGKRSVILVTHSAFSLPFYVCFSTLLQLSVGRNTARPASVTPAGSIGRRLAQPSEECAQGRNPTPGAAASAPAPSTETTPRSVAKSLSRAASGVIMERQIRAREARVFPQTFSRFGSYILTAARFAQGGRKI